MKEESSRLQAEECQHLYSLAVAHSIQDGVFGHGARGMGHGEEINQSPPTDWIFPPLSMKALIYRSFYC